MGGVFLTPFQTRTAHVVQFGSIGIEDPLPKSARNYCHRTSRREVGVFGHFANSKNRNCGVAHDDHSLLRLSPSRYCRIVFPYVGSAIAPKLSTDSVSYLFQIAEFGFWLPDFSTNENRAYVVPDLTNVAR